MSNRFFQLQILFLEEISGLNGVFGLETQFLEDS